MVCAIQIDVLTFFLFLATEHGARVRRLNVSVKQAPVAQFIHFASAFVAVVFSQFVALSSAS